MCSDNNISLFICKTCNRERPKKLEQTHKRNRCKICDSFKRQSENHSIGSNFYNEFEEKYIHALDLRERGVVECLGCGVEAKRDDLHKKTRRCWTCHSERKTQYRRNQRFNEAIKKNRTYEARHLHDAHVSLYTEFGLTVSHVQMYYAHIKYLNELFEKRKKPPRGERKTTLDKLSHLSDVQMSRVYSKVSKPWNNPRLSQAEAWRLRYSIDIDFMIAQRMRTRIKKKHGRWVADYMRQAISRNGESPKIKQLLGYSIKDLREHLERNFTGDMNWEAFKSGDIHIDHIIPMAAFDMNDMQQLKECWSLSNIQPLWASDNISKSDTMPDGTRARDM